MILLFALDREAVPLLEYISKVCERNLKPKESKLTKETPRKMEAAMPVSVFEVEHTHRPLTQ